MTCALVVNSKSGNTRMVSGAIKRALQAAGVEFVHAAALSDDADADQVALEAQGACAADTVLVGFWCDKGACTPSVAALLSALHGKRVFLFGTCGFGADQSYYQQDSTKPARKPSRMFLVLLGLKGLAGTRAEDMMVGSSVFIFSAM